MASSRRGGSGPAITRLRPAGLGLFLGMALALAYPARAAAGDSAGTDTLPPAGTFIAAYVADSATGLPLAGASVTIQNSAANISIANTDARGWAYINEKGLPYGYRSPDLWITAGYPGHLSRLITLSRCGEGNPAPCALRFALAAATEKNSLAFAGTLLDTARKPIAGLLLDVSSAVGSGWISWLARTDENGRFVFKDITKGLRTGYVFVRRSPSSFEMLMVYWDQSGDSIVVPRWSATALAPSRAQPRVSARGKPAPVLLFRSPQRDAAGRRRE